VSIQTNFIDERFPSIRIELNNASKGKLPVAILDIINLCGGIPSPDITNVHVNITPTYASSLSVKINADQYEVARNMDFEIGRIDNNYMHVKDKGKGIGTNLFLNQVRTARKLGFKKLYMVAFAPSDELAWYGYYFWANLGFQNTDVDDYLNWANAMGRKEPTLSELMQSESGRELWKNTGFTWIGNFYLAKGHPCLEYLRMHLQRKKIDFSLGE
jgi:hypothetical protein